MKHVIGFFIISMLFSCGKDEMDFTTENGTRTWNRELYKVTPTYKYVNSIRIESDPTEEFISYDIVHLTSLEAQNQQDSLYRSSAGKYLYRFKMIKEKE